MTTTLSGRLAGLAAENHGIFTRQQVLSCGYSDDEIKARTRAGGPWQRLRRGVFVEREFWVGLDDLERHLRQIRAALVHVAAPAVVSHLSAAALHGLDLHQPDFSLVHLSRGDLHSPRKHAGIHHHAGGLDPEEVVTLDGLAVTTPARTVVDLAHVVSFEQAVVTADSALHRGLSQQDLLAQHLRATDWPGARNAGRVVSFADGRAESPGETLARVALDRLGLPKPELQISMHDSSGRLYARIDMGYPEAGIGIEFDGKRKYYRDLQVGQDPGDVGWLEKRREDRLREEFGIILIRIVWADLFPDRLPILGQRIRTALARSAARTSLAL